METITITRITKIDISEVETVETKRFNTVRFYKRIKSGQFIDNKNNIISERKLYNIIKCGYTPSFINGMGVDDNCAITFNAIDDLLSDMLNRNKVVIFNRSRGGGYYYITQYIINRSDVTEVTYNFSTYPIARYRYKEQSQISKLELIETVKKGLICGKCVYADGVRIKL